MTAAVPESPTDYQIIEVIGRNGGAVEAPVLMDALVALGHAPEEVLRAIQRTLERGKIGLGDNLRLVVSQRAEAA